MNAETKTIRYHRTLFYYDGIQAFEARDVEGGHYVAVLARDDGYTIVRIAPERLPLFWAGCLDLRSLLVESHPEDRYVTTAKAGIDQPLVLEKLTEPLNDALLPETGFLVHKRSLDIGRQIDELRVLEDGWLDGEGRAPSKAGLDWLLGVFGTHYPDDAARPYFYPTEAGGVQAEWPLGSREAELEIDLETHVGEWHVLDMKSGESQERTLHCDREEDWLWLIEQIRAVT